MIFRIPTLSARWVAPKATVLCITKRTFYSLPALRPSLDRPTIAFARRTQPTTTASTTASTAMLTTSSTSVGEQTDLVPRTWITSHPAFASPANQVRFGPRNTMQRATRLIQKRRHGFLNRLRTKNGRKMLARRRAKGRSRLGKG